MAAAVLILLLAAAPSLLFAEECKAPQYFVIDNTNLVATDYTQFKDYSEEECQKVCTSNKGPNGTPVPCSSFTYDHLSFTCTIYAIKSVPQGTAQVQNAVGKRFFEKFCLPAEIPGCVESQFIRADDSVLIGFASNVSLVDTIEDCVSHCVKDVTCKSAMFFYEEGECITNNESALSRPASFAREDTEKVIYFQNGCSAKTSSPDVTTQPSTTVSPHDIPIREQTRPLPRSAELPVSLENSEEVRTSPATTTAHTTTTTKTKPTTTSTAAEEEEYDPEELVEDDITTTTVAPIKKKKSFNEIPYELVKYKKHAKNFASKTLQYKPKKTDKTDKVPRVFPEDAEVEHESVEEVFQKPIRENPNDFFSEWSAWTPCRQSGERRIRRRKCLDLRRCLGALMQVENCPAVVPKLIEEEDITKPIESVRSIIDEPTDVDPLAGIDEPIPVISTKPEAPIALSVESTPVGDAFIWSPWQGVCQKFASGQPCNNGEMIGFESRECVAKDPSKCEGPFFRYCTLPC